MKEHFDFSADELRELKAALDRGDFTLRIGSHVFTCEDLGPPSSDMRDYPDMTNLAILWHIEGNPHK